MQWHINEATGWSCYFFFLIDLLSEGPHLQFPAFYSMETFSFFSACCLPRIFAALLSLGSTTRSSSMRQPEEPKSNAGHSRQSGPLPWLWRRGGFADTSLIFPNFIVSCFTTVHQTASFGRMYDKTLGVRGRLLQSLVIISF